MHVANYNFISLQNFPRHSHIIMLLSECYYNLNFMLSVRSLVRILKDMQKHVPGLQHLDSWYIQLLVS